MQNIKTLYQIANSRVYVYMTLSGWYTYLQPLAYYGILWVIFI